MTSLDSDSHAKCGCIFSALVTSHLAVLLPLWMRGGKHEEVGSYQHTSWYSSSGKSYESCLSTSGDSCKECGSLREGNIRDRLSFPLPLTHSINRLRPSS